MNTRILLAFLATTLLAACSGGGADSGGTTGSTTTGGSSGGTSGGTTGGGTSGGSSGGAYGIETRPTLGALAFPEQGAQSGDVQVLAAFPKLSFKRPLFFAVAPGDASRVFVVTQGGQVLVFVNDANADSSRVFLDLSDRTHVSGEQGLLGLAFDPDFAGSGYVYAYYVDLRNGDPGVSTISRFQVTGSPDAADRSSELKLFTTAQPFGNHKGGWIGFGPDRKLYVALGDGGSGGDPQGNGQNLNTPLGKILRLNADGSIPVDNPFFGQAGKRGEIWAYGLRNPFRDSFDRATGMLWIADVGQNAYEEIDLGKPGANYGWNLREGLHGYPDADAPKPPGSDFTDPIAEYDHKQGCAIIGGYVYRGGALPKLNGQYLYTDECSGTLWALTTRDGAAVANAVLGQVPGNPTSFGEDHAGELYFTSFNGGIYRLAPGSGGGAAFPQKLSQTGLFTDTAALQPNAGLIEYDINAPFWSDGARKRRWIGVPNGAHIGFDAHEAWTLPAGSVVVKHFEITLAGGGSKRLETRVLLNTPAGWQGYTYRWNEAGSDADLLADSASVQLATANGAQTYEFPSRAACLRCHTAAAGYLLGLRSAQLNRSFTYPGGVADNELRTLNHIGLFDRDIGDAEQYPALAVPTDADAPLARRARAYLEINCAQCHRPGGPTPVDMDLRADTAIAATHTLDVAPSEGDLGLAGARRIAPGRKEASVLWERMRRLDGTRMPPLASHLVDAAGVDLIGQWIDAGAM